MELGFSSLGHVFNSIRSNKFHTLFEILLEGTKAGLEFGEENKIGVCEVVLEPPEIFSRENQNRFIDMCISYSIKKQVHGPLIDVQMCSYNDLISNATMESYLESAKICDKINSDILVIHPGSGFGGRFFRTVGTKKLINSVKNLLKNVAQLCPNVKICIENMPRRAHFFNYVEEINQFFDELNREDIFMTWDTSHSWTCDTNLEDFWENFHKVIKNIHLADNDNKEGDSHPELGSAKVDFQEIFDVIKKYNYNDNLIVELSSTQGILNSFEFIKKFL
ncbi:MAG: sugar phosphate isomerase/epimerase family protein [Promethearchaeota archaeon]|jgi:sugar phosphate isomerase/epimerase